ncbi:hypothetical protein SAMN05443637_13031 [Pseudonocardia thermophila]|jgi:hypothetical protein|uniref:Uncharacterized protein n=1 Tax=Pseudonocardia thermophila TaxID=1848 RepID=A0A1M7AVU9_PSETH|nr:hypothetical protein [Pseudonocardia thermophila]SHL46756.1 hypothetical protein SAMN05443637_13031 [Pseudonocardia thermophila]
MSDLAFTSAVAALSGVVEVQFHRRGPVLVLDEHGRVTERATMPRSAAAADQLALDLDGTREAA